MPPQPAPAPPTTGTPPPTPPGGGLSIPDFIRQEARAVGLPEQLALGVAEQESSFDPAAVGKPFKLPNGQTTQAHGLFQLIPETAARYQVDPMDPVQNVRGGVRYLKDLWDQNNGDVNQVLATYGGVRTDPTYIPSVMQRVMRWQQQQQQAPGAAKAKVPAWATPEGAAAVGGASQADPNAPRTGSALSRYAQGVWTTANPIEMAEGLVKPFIPNSWGEAVGIHGTGPEEAIKNIAKASYDQYQQGKQYWNQGQYNRAIGHFGSAFPVLGPAIGQVGEDLRRSRETGQDLAGSLGEATGLVLPLLIPGMAKGTAEVASRLPGAEAAADWAMGAARKRLEDVMAPKVGGQKGRFANMAEKASEGMTTEPGMWAASRHQLFGRVRNALEAVEAQMDDHANNRLGARALDTTTPTVDPNTGERLPVTDLATGRPKFDQNRQLVMRTPSLLERLQEKRDALVSQANQASQYPPPYSDLTPHGEQTILSKPISVPYGQDVIPKDIAPRIAQIDDAIAQVKQLGATSRYEPLRRLRASFDQSAKRIYNPIAPDAFSNLQVARGAADVTGAIRDFLADADPVQDELNRKYSFLKNAHDALDAAEEFDKSRPRVGRKLITQGFGLLAGKEAGGIGGMLGGYVLSPIVESLMNAGFTPQITTARILGRISDALRSGDTAGAASLTRQLYQITRNQGLRQEGAGYPPPPPPDQQQGAVATPPPAPPSR